MGTTITCKQAVDYISKKEDGKLSPTKRFRLWRHLAVCSICRIFSQQNKIISKAFSTQQIDKGLSDTEKEIIIQSVLTNDGN